MAPQEAQAAPVLMVLPVRTAASAAVREILFWVESCPAGCSISLRAVTGATEAKAAQEGAAVTVPPAVRAVQAVRAVMALRVWSNWRVR